MDRLEELQNKLLESFIESNSKALQRYKKMSNILQIKKTKFSTNLNKIEEIIVREIENDGADSLLEQI